MIFEHEIPTGSKLYFGDAAKKKRAIEAVASEVLSHDGFEEIVTPLFSYHQHQSISDEREIIRVNDRANHNMSLRADSTIDVVRIISKRLGRNTSHSKWFYIQPVYRYPSSEQYQVGAEFINEKDVSKVLCSTIKIFQKLEIKPLLQLSNIKIPQLLSQSLNLDINDFRHINIQKFLSLNIDWLTQLVYLHKVEQIQPLLEIVPAEIKEELIKLQELSEAIEYDTIAIAPLYYAKMLYYDELYFRFIDQNDTYARGGRYKNDDVTSVGFAITTDTLIESQKD